MGAKNFNGPSRFFAALTALDFQHDERHVVEISINPAGFRARVGGGRAYQTGADRAAAGSASGISSSVASTLSHKSAATASMNATGISARS